MNMENLPEVPILDVKLTLPASNNDVPAVTPVSGAEIPAVVPVSGAELPAGKPLRGRAAGARQLKQDVPFVIKRKNNELSLAKKVELLKFLETAKSERKAAELFGISKTSVNNIKKRKLEFLKRYNEEHENGNVCRKERRTENHEVNEATWKWFQQMRGINAHISGPMIKETAMDFAKRLNVKNFSASNGWLDSFKKRHNVVIDQKSPRRKSNKMDPEKIEALYAKVEEICAGYDLADVFNADETGLFFRAIPDKSFATKGRESLEEHVAVLLAVSVRGEKLVPLVLGTSQRPRSFCSILPEHLPVVWRSSHKALMIRELFCEWVYQINDQMKRTNRHILLVVDNCPAHPKMQPLSNVEVKFVPANTTSILRPLDRGIVPNFKLLYRLKMLQAVIAKSSYNISVRDVAKNVTVLDAVLWIAEAWGEVSKVTISNSFQKAGFRQLELQPENTTLTETVQQLFNQVAAENPTKVKEFLTAEGKIQLFGSVNSSKIITDVVGEMRGNLPLPVQPETTDFSSYDVETSLCDEPVPTTWEIKHMFERIKAFSVNRCPEALVPIATAESKFFDYLYKNKHDSVPAPVPMPEPQNQQLCNNYWISYNGVMNSSCQNSELILP